LFLKKKGDEPKEVKQNWDVPEFFKKRKGTFDSVESYTSWPKKRRKNS